MLRQPVTTTGPARERVDAIGASAAAPGRDAARRASRAAALCAAFMGFALLAGCGVKGPLVPPRKAAVPRPPAAPAAPAAPAGPTAPAAPPPATTAPEIPEASAPARPNPAP